jgi:hypothetical protein
MSTRPLARRALAGILSGALALAVASAAGAQQLPESRLARTSPSGSSTDIIARDSALRWMYTARVQQRTGASLVAAGLGAIGAAFVQYTRAGRMGMSGPQATTFVAGAALGGVGASRWLASRESRATAERWEARR